MNDSPGAGIIGESSVRDGLGEGAYVITVAGEFDLALADAAEAGLGRGLESGQPLVFDLTACSFIDSSAIRVLTIAARKLADAGHGLALAASNPQVLRVFQLTQLDDVIAVRPTVVEAVAAAAAV